MLIMGIEKGFLTNLLFTSPQKLKKRTVSFFFCTKNDGEAHSDVGCCSITPRLHNLSTSLMSMSLFIFGTGKAWPW
jgi:hypothetical protein